MQPHVPIQITWNPNRRAIASRLNLIRSPQTVKTPQNPGANYNEQETHFPRDVAALGITTYM